MITDAQIEAACAIIWAHTQVGSWPPIQDHHFTPQWREAMTSVYRNAMRAALEAADAARWQSIETAPAQDGYILVRAIYGDVVRIWGTTLCSLNPDPRWSHWAPDLAPPPEL